MKQFSFKALWNEPLKRRWRDDRRAILEFNRSLSLIADPKTLTASIVARLKEIFGTDKCILLRANDGGIMTTAFHTGYETEELRDVRLSHRDRLAKWLMTNQSLLVTDADKNIVDYLSGFERDLLARLNVRVCIPLMALNRLTGVMFLSSSDKKWKYTQDDLNLLQLLMGQASIAFENAYLSQQQRDRLRRLYRAETLATAGQLAASVAHEIRNPLTSIRSTVQYLLSDLKDEDPRHNLIEGVISEVDRIDRTLEGLLNLTRGTEFKPEKVALSQLIRQTLMLIQTQANSQSVECVMLTPPTELYIMGDTSQLRQLFLNLMLNALQAMREVGRLEVGLSIKPESVGSSRERSLAQVTLKDSGCGIPPENLDKIFDPFFTTKQVGTGLGLPTSYAICQSHGGEMEIESREGEGTTVVIWFPLVN